MREEKIRFIGRVVKKVDPSMAKIFMPWILKHPKSIPTMLKLAKTYRKSRLIRNFEFFANELKVPPFLIISITSSCNLRCQGCYAAATGTLCNHPQSSPLKIDQWRKIIQEAQELGVFGFIIAGGEPFILPDLLELSEEFRENLFIIFTNGTLLNEEKIKQLKKLKNTVIIVNLEGDCKATDSRRGKGVHEKVISTIKRLSKNGIISGISATINKKNLDYWMKDRNVDSLIEEGIKIAFFLEYIPVDNDLNNMLTLQESKEFRNKVLEYRNSKEIFIIHSPGDEEYMGGCVSAGRGFAHITPSGDLTPCPVSNIATHNLVKSTLRDGFKSPLFKIIRESEHLLETKGSPCALFAHPEEINELAIKVKAYKTSSI
jgi:MoaA/NifB/PqqE/SkfB family radical SAM enzyme